jgi:hypothetical protein
MHITLLIARPSFEDNLLVWYPVYAGVGAWNRLNGRIGLNEAA